MVKLRNPFCVSGALMKEIFKMYWYIPLITFVLYFFTGIIPKSELVRNISVNSLIFSGLIMRSSTFAIFIMYCRIIPFKSPLDTGGVTILSFETKNILVVAPSQISPFVFKINQLFPIISNSLSKSS